MCTFPENCAIESAEMKKNIQRLLLACVLIGGAAILSNSSSKAECDPQDAAVEGDTEIANATCGPKSQLGNVTSTPTSQTATVQVFTDPRTGEMIKPPVGTGIQETKDTLKTSAEGLVETPSLVPGGGEGVNLQGRFNRPVTTTQGVDEKGSSR